MIALAATAWELRAQLQTERGELSLRTETVTGTVMIATGGPAPKNTQVELICGGRQVLSRFTDKKGRFSISFRYRDAQRSLLHVASNNIGSGCAVRAVSKDHVSSRVPVREGMAVVLFPRDKSAGALVSITTLEAPEEAKAALEKAENELSGSDPNVDAAVRHLERAVAIYPQFAAAWHLLGTTLWRNREFERAINAFESALEADRGFLPVYRPLVGIRADQADWAEVVSMAETWASLQPTAIEADYYLCWGYLNLRLFERSLTPCRNVADSSVVDRFVHAYHFLGVAYAALGDYQRAAVELRRYLELQPDAEAATKIKAQLAQWRADGLLDGESSGAPQ